MRRTPWMTTVAAAVLLVAGCSGGDDGEPTTADTAAMSQTPDQDATPTAEETQEATEDSPAALLTVEDLAAALPDAAALDGYDNVKVCGTSPADRELCGHEENEVSVTGNRSGDDATWGIGGGLAITMRVEADAAAAEAMLASDQQVHRSQEGAFDEPPEDLGEGRYKPGLRGTGTVEELSVDGWRGSRSVLLQHLYNDDGEQTEQPITECNQIIVRGNAVIRVAISAAGDQTASIAADADRWIARILDALPE